MGGAENILSKIGADSDTLLILALVFVLYKQNADKMLIFALIYILIV